MNKTKLKQKIKKAKWFGMLDYDDNIFVSQDLENVLQESMFADNLEQLLETNFSECGDCYCIDEYVFTAGETKREVVNELRKMITNVHEV